MCLCQLFPNNQTFSILLFLEMFYIPTLIFILDKDINMSLKGKKIQTDFYLYDPEMIFFLMFLTKKQTIFSTLSSLFEMFGSKKKTLYNIPTHFK